MSVLDGITRIAIERQRQITEERYDTEHDRGRGDDLALAGAAYAIPVYAGRRRDLAGGSRFVFWPWQSEYWKPTPEDRIRELTKAGALIAAAIDALISEAPDA